MASRRRILKSFNICLFKSFENSHRASGGCKTYQPRSTTIQKRRDPNAAGVGGWRSAPLRSLNLKMPIAWGVRRLLYVYSRTAETMLTTQLKIAIVPAPT